MSREQSGFPRLDPDLNQLIYVVGRKGSGKSVNARELVRDWPYIDKLTIDPTGDADPGECFSGVDAAGNPLYETPTVTVRELPARLPDPPKPGEFTSTRWVANPGSPTYRDDLDRAVGLALFPKDRRVLLWVDEAGEVFPAGRLGPNARTMLKQSRHWYASVIMCDPRPINVDPLCLAQADRIVMYDVPHPRDRERLAGSMGVPPRQLIVLLDELRGMQPHSYLLYDAKAHELYLCPPLPMSEGHKHAQQ